MFFNIRAIRTQIGKINWDFKTYRRSYKTPFFYKFRSQRPQFRPQWMSPEEFADKNHPKWEEYRRRISIAERVSLIHRDWGAGNTIDLTRNLTKHQFSKIQNRHIQSMFSY